MCRARVGGWLFGILYLYDFFLLERSIKNICIHFIEMCSLPKHSEDYESYNSNIMKRHDVLFAWK